jgi:hypothetical protein
MVAQVDYYKFSVAKDDEEDFIVINPVVEDTNIGGRFDEVAPFKTQYFTISVLRVMMDMTTAVKRTNIHARLVIRPPSDVCTTSRDTTSVLFTQT